MASEHDVVQTDTRKQARREVDEVLGQLVDDQHILKTSTIARRTTSSTTNVAKVMAALRDGRSAPWLADRWSIDTWGESQKPIKYVVTRTNDGSADPVFNERNADIAMDIADEVGFEYDPDRVDVNGHAPMLVGQRRQVVAALLEDIEPEDLEDYPKRTLSHIAGRVLDADIDGVSCWTRSELLALRDGLEDAPLTTAAEAGLDLEEGGG